MLPLEFGQCRLQSQNLLLEDCISLLRLIQVFLLPHLFQFLGYFVCSWRSEIAHRPFDRVSGAFERFWVSPAPATAPKPRKRSRPWRAP